MWFFSRSPILHELKNKMQAFNALL